MQMKLGTKRGPYGSFEQALEIMNSDGSVTLLTETGIKVVNKPVVWDQQRESADWFSLAVDLMGNRICADEDIQKQILLLINPAVIEDHLKNCKTSCNEDNNKEAYCG